MAPLELLPNIAVYAPSETMRKAWPLPIDSLYVYLDALAYVESRGRVTAHNSDTDAYGMFQFLPPTWAMVGVQRSSSAAAQLAAEERLLILDLGWLYSLQLDDGRTWKQAWELAGKPFVMLAVALASIHHNGRTNFKNRTIGPRGRAHADAFMTRLQANGGMSKTYVVVSPDETGGIDGTIEKIGASARSLAVLALVGFGIYYYLTKR